MAKALISKVDCSRREATTGCTHTHTHIGVEQRTFLDRERESERERERVREMALLSLLCPSSFLQRFTALGLSIQFCWQRRKRRSPPESFPSPFAPSPFLALVPWLCWKDLAKWRSKVYLSVWCVHKVSLPFSLSLSSSFAFETGPKYRWLERGA